MSSLSPIQDLLEESELSPDAEERELLSSYKPLDDLILNSPFRKKELTGKRPYTINKDKDTILDSFVSASTSKKLDSAIVVIEKRIELSNKASSINRRVHESLSEYDKKSGGLRYGLAKRRRIAGRTKDLMESLVHSQTIGSTRVRKTLSGINKWVKSHDKDPLKDDDTGSDSSSEDEKMDDEDIKISEREVKVMLRNVTNKRKSLQNSFDEAVNVLNGIWEKRLFDANQKRIEAEKKTKMAKLETKEKVKEIRAQRKNIEGLKENIRDLKYKIDAKNREVQNLKFDVKRAKQETEALREQQRKQSIDGMSLEDMRDKIQELEMWKKDNEVKCHDLETERDGAVRTAQILESQATELSNQLAKLREIDEKEDLNYDTDGNPLSEELAFQKRKYERRMMAKREEFELKMHALEMRLEQLKDTQLKEIKTLKERQHVVIANLKKGQIELEKKYLNKIEIIEHDNQQTVRQLEANMEKVKEDNAIDRMNLQRVHVKDVRDLKDEYELKIKAIKDKNEEENKAQRQRLLLMKAHVDEVRESAQKKITETINKMAINFNNEKEKYIEQFTRDKERYRQQVLDATKTQGEAYLRVLENHQRQIEQIKKEYDDKVLEREAFFSAKVDDARAEYEAKHTKLIQEYDDQKKKWKNEAGFELLQHVQALEESKHNGVAETKELKGIVSNLELQLHSKKSKILNLQSEVARNEDHVRGLQHHIKELRVRLSNVQNNYQDLKFEYTAREKKLNAAPSKDYIHRDEVEKLIAKLVLKIDTLEQERESLAPECKSPDKGNNIPLDKSIVYLEELTAKCKECQELSQFLCSFIMKDQGTFSHSHAKELGLRAERLEHYARKCAQSCLLCVAKFGSISLDSKWREPSVAGKLDPTVPSTSRSLSAHNSPKNRFFIKGHRQIASATMPPQLLSETVPAEAESYQAQSLPANVKFVRKSKRQNPPEERLKISAHIESNKVLVGTSIFRGNNNNNDGLADSLSHIPQQSPINVRKGGNVRGKIHRLGNKQEESHLMTNTKLAVTYQVNEAPKFLVEGIIRKRI